LAKHKNRSLPTGVYRSKSGGYYALASVPQSTHHFLGVFQTIEEAAQTRQRYQELKKRNDGSHLSMVRKKSPQPRTLPKHIYQARSGFKVTFNRDGKMHYLGTFPSIELAQDALNAFNKAQALQKAVVDLQGHFLDAHNPTIIKTDIL
jgi:hypothetical protein